MSSISTESLTLEKIAELGIDDLKDLANKLLAEQGQDRRENQLLFYHAVSPRTREIHMTLETILGVGGGNRSSKTDTCLADLVIR